MQYGLYKKALVLTIIFLFVGAGVFPNPMLSIYASDADSELMNISFRTNAGGTWQTITSYSNVGNGSRNASPVNMDSYSTLYWWSVNYSDGTGWTNMTYSFTTTSEPEPGLVIPDWRNVTHEPFPVTVPSGVTNPVLTGSDVTDKSASFVADPFMFHEDGNWYMFFEVEDGVSADIGLATSTDGLNWTYDQIVLDTDFHKSYPVVFKFNGTYYMIPECVPDYVKLYKSEAGDFPYNWMFVDDLLSGRDFADPSIFRFNDTWWMFVSDAGANNCWLYYSDNLTNPSAWIEHLSSPITTDSSKARPGGRPIVFDNDRIIRFTQKCDVSYGEMVRAFEVDTLTKTSYAEHEVPESPVVQKSGSGWNSSAMHNFDPWWTGDRWIAAVDANGVYSWCIGIYTTPIVGDVTPPEITNVGANPSVQEMNGYVNITCNVTDNVDVDTVMVNISYPDNFVVNVSMTNIDGTDEYYYNSTYEIEGLHSYFIWVNDTNGNENISETCQFEIIEATIELNISLYYGWNLITIPVEKTYTAMTLAENITNSIMISRFDAENQTYKTYIVGGPPGFDFPIVDGYGYFVLVDQSSTLSMSGYRIESVSVPLSIGWNMIGWYHSYNTMASSLGENITGCIMVSWSDSISQTFKTYIVGGLPGFDFIITPGMGLFVLVDTESVWHGEG